MDSPKLLTVEEAAVTLRCGRTRVYALLAEGVLVRGPCFGKKTVILAESVYAACEMAYHPAPAAAPRKRVRKAQARADFDAAIDAL